MHSSWARAQRTQHQEATTFGRVSGAYGPAGAVEPTMTMIIAVARARFCCTFFHLESLRGS